MVPYTGRLGARVLTFEPGHVVVELKERRAVRNHLSSVHAMALWDLDRPDGPYVDDLRHIRRALREDHWVLAFGGNHYFLGPLADDYEPMKVITPEGGPALMPKTGLRAMPWRTMVPIPGVE